MQNLLLKDNKEGDLFSVVISDFGMSKVQSVSNTLAPTAAGVSLAFCAPEVLTSVVAKRQPPSDVFSMGMVLYHLATRTPPWQGLNPAIIQMHVCGGTRPPLPEDSLVAQEHPAYVDLMQRCWSQDPEARPSFEEVVRQLEAMAPRQLARNDSMGGDPYDDV